MTKLYKILFFNSMMLGTLLAISSSSWLGMWMGLEINLLSIIPLMNSPKTPLSSEASLKYFITQTMASLILLLSIVLMMVSGKFITPMMNSTFMTLLNSALLTKLGAAPFHFWFPEVMEGLDWINCTILLTWQKIAPMILIMNNPPMENFLLIVILLSLMISTLMSLNQISLRKIMAFSSINHIAWMISASIVSFPVWTIYLLVYIIITMNLTFIFNESKIFFLSQIPSFMNQSKIIKLTMMINFLSLGGLPPFLGFMPKWFTINWMITNNYLVLALLLIIATLIMLFVYVRIMMTSMIVSHNEPKLFPVKLNKATPLMINFLTISSLISCTLMCNLS
uniref:NADH dehydrogenase subunit 2 n=1 Tax=Spastonyx nemognathoides TaxID=2908340 RepID=UPI001EE08E30|nr:NADH dehydrogenase subunit 2 [Spastonyx nemognathoides]UKE80225.1 NADH dehydrogenase subunit 2 [Spastonyx nemognathoides]